MDPPSCLYRGAEQPEYRGFRLAPGVGRTELDGTPFYRLRLFRPAGGARGAPVLIVPPLSGHFPVLLRDMVLGFLEEAPVAVIDWANVRHVPLAAGTFGLGDNIAAIRRAIVALGPGVSVVALCQAGVPALAAVADLAAAGGRDEAAPAALSLVAAPIDPLANPTAVVDLIRAHSRYWYDIVPTATVPPGPAGQGRWVYPATTQLAALHAYLGRQLEADTELARKLARDDGADPARFPFLDLYTSIMDVDARHFAENIDAVFLRRLLPRGALTFEGRTIDPGVIRRTVLTTVEGGADDIAAPGQTVAAQALCPALPAGARHGLVVPEAGHFSLFHGEVWRREVLPFLRSTGIGAPGPAPAP
ncbi:alpha/beta hydrolase family protein [Acidimangrovimonas sediminis]|uniref:polyhydroxyalkanoate depolymerase n=1 Tax=Acidimangrovimonas sediminis TaxID=2056283 RepID=UPI0013048ED1|nr:polyhydroxyalkanoate depolymerase [Acidimangrovimonas sediminis]